MSTELKKDSLDLIVTFLASVGWNPLLNARAKLASGATLNAVDTAILKTEGYDLSHCACYAEKDPKDVCIEKRRIHTLKCDYLVVFEEDGTDRGKFIAEFGDKGELKKVIEMCGWCVVGGKEFLED